MRRQSRDGSLATMFRVLQVVTIASVALLAGCSKAKKPEVGVEHEEARPPIDACALLTSDEIQSVQGEAVQQTTPSNSTGGAYYAAQCYYALPTNANSVVVTVTQRVAGPGGKSPREWWKETFHHEPGEEKEGRGERDEDEKRKPPMKVDGLGDEAFWAAAGIGGALYVLKGDVYLRVSTGTGPAQLEKTKQLAELALKRL